MSNTLWDRLKYNFNRSNNAVVQLILINVIVWALIIIPFIFLGLVSRGTAAGLMDFVGTWLMLPSDLSLLITRPWTLVTTFFLHIDLFHILFNMLWLYWFARIIQEFLGSRHLVSLYVWGGFAGGIFFLISYNVFPALIESNAALLGASGAVYAVVVGAATFMPDYRFNLILLGPVRIVWIAAFMVVSSYVAVGGDNAGGNLAHLGGALLGYLYISQLKKGNDWSGPLYRVFNWFRGIFNPSRRIKVSHSNYSKRGGSGSRRSSGSSRSQGSRVPQNGNGKSVSEQEEIDAILDKISDKGYEALTKEEKQKLFKASQK